MAIDFHDLSAVSDMLKNVYGEGFTNQFQDEHMTYNQFPKSDRKPRGNGYVFGIRYERAQGVGARGESQHLPDPLAGKYDQATISPKYMYGSLKLTGPMIEAAKGDTAAFVDGLADSMDDIYKSVIDSMNRQCHGDGFGLIATLSAASDALTTSSTTWTVTCNNDRGLMYAREGMLVDFYNSTSLDASASGSRISTISLADKTCEMEYNASDYTPNHPLGSSITIATSTVASGSYMVAAGSRAATHATTNTSYELTGLLGIFDDGTLLGTFEGITVASYPKWKANLLGNSDINRELTLDLMLQAENLTRLRAGSGVNINMRMGLGQRRKYFGLLAPDVRFQPTTFEGGFETLTFHAGNGATKIIVDPMTQPNRIFFDPVGAIKKYEMTPLGWGNLDQQMHQRSNYDEWECFLRCYTNLGVEQRNHLTVIEDLVEPNIYS